MQNILADLSGKTILVTGASSGIGAATAEALAKAGAITDGLFADIGHRAGPRQGRRQGRFGRPPA